MTTGELLALLRRHYIKPSQPLPGGVFLPEVGWNPPAGPAAATEAVTQSMWGSPPAVGESLLATS